MIQFQSGLWDLAYFGREDAMANRSTYEPLTADRLEWWTERTVSVIQQIKTQYPGVPILYRTMHRPDTNEAYRDFIWDKQGVQKVNFFTDVRAAQIRQLQIAVAEQEGLLLWDFGKVFEGFQGESFTERSKRMTYALHSSRRQRASYCVPWWCHHVTSSVTLRMARQAVEAIVIERQRKGRFAAICRSISEQRSSLLLCNCAIAGSICQIRHRGRRLRLHFRTDLFLLAQCGQARTKLASATMNRTISSTACSLHATDANAT